MTHGAFNLGPELPCSSGEQYAVRKLIYHTLFQLRIERFLRFTMQTVKLQRSIVALNRTAERKHSMIPRDGLLLVYGLLVQAHTAPASHAAVESRDRRRIKKSE